MPLQSETHSPNHIVNNANSRSSTGGAAPHGRKGLGFSYRLSFLGQVQWPLRRTSSERTTFSYSECMFSEKEDAHASVATTGIVWVGRQCYVNRRVNCAQADKHRTIRHNIDHLIRLQLKQSTHWDVVFWLFRYLQINCREFLML